MLLFLGFEKEKLPGREGNHPSLSRRNLEFRVRPPAGTSNPTSPRRGRSLRAGGGPGCGGGACVGRRPRLRRKCGWARPSSSSPVPLVPPPAGAPRCDSAPRAGRPGCQHLARTEAPGSAPLAGSVMLSDPPTLPPSPPFLLSARPQARLGTAQVKSWQVRAQVYRRFPDRITGEKRQPKPGFFPKRLF